MTTIKKHNKEKINFGILSNVNSLTTFKNKGEYVIKLTISLEPI